MISKRETLMKLTEWALSQTFNGDDDEENWKLTEND